TATRLNGYYIFIHQYFPILPPPVSSTTIVDNSIARSQDELDDGDVTFCPSSPLSLAIAAILALIPHDQCPEPSSEDAIVFRRRYSHFLVQSAMESIDIESEMPGSSTSPDKALSEDHAGCPRAPFHPMVPVELESVIALALLSIYEYSQRGNIARMRNRAGQALVNAMDLCLHSAGEEYDHFEEARRRAWWMTYVCVCQGSIYSSTPPIISVLDPSFTRQYPSIAADAEAWPFFIESQQTILRATQFVADLNKTLEKGEDLQIIRTRMQELESDLVPLVAKADAFAQGIPSFNPIDSEEEIVAETLKVMARIKINSARIKLHRYCAFFDHPIFSRKHCDLKPVPLPGSVGRGRTASISSIGCGCSGSFGMMIESSPGGGIPSKDLPTFSNDDDALEQFPFSSRTSQKICLKAALNIVQSFEALPYPFVVSNKQIPRTMPSMSCCAMQSSYALLMLRQKTLSEQRCSNDVYVQTLFVKIHRALQSIAGTLDNYAIAAEAIAGMRGVYTPQGLGLKLWKASDNGEADSLSDQIRESIQVHFGG
ncbi:hypothetical protein NA57DRAFT_31841, partial [Rhizodiscina lignyota]